MNLGAWFTSTVTIASLTARDARGAPSFGDQRAIKARVEPKRKLIRGTNGQETVADHVVYTISPVLITDRVWLPGVSTGDAKGAKVPLMITATPDKSGRFTLYEVTI